MYSLEDMLQMANEVRGSDANPDHFFWEREVDIGVAEAYAMTLPFSRPTDFFLTGLALGIWIAERRAQNNVVRIFGPSA